jgi:hypothetical protein
VTRKALAERRNEFESHLWNHSEDRFQAEFDQRRPLHKKERAVLRMLVKLMGERKSHEQIALAIRTELRKNPELMLTLLQIAGLTRNKIIQDLRAALAGTSISVPSSPLRLHLGDAIWARAGRYLSGRLGSVLQNLSGLGANVDAALEALNQATWPGWIRQERAKRQGHEAEFRLATVLEKVGIPFEPAEKADNPLCRDAQVHGVSFDLVVPTAREPMVCAKATVHTANIGQYGESKDVLEIEEAARMIAAHFSGAAKPTLLALIDGVGFRSNRAGLDRVLSSADEFCQFRTLWKAVVVAAARLGRRIKLALPAAEIEFHRRFLERHKRVIHLVELKGSEFDHYPKAVAAGDGFILLR